MHRMLPRQLRRNPLPESSVAMRSLRGRFCSLDHSFCSHLDFSPAEDLSWAVRLPNPDAIGSPFSAGSAQRRIAVAQPISLAPLGGSKLPLCKVGQAT